MRWVFSPSFSFPGPLGLIVAAALFVLTHHSSAVFGAWCSLCCCSLSLRVHGATRPSLYWLLSTAFSSVFESFCVFVVRHIVSCDQPTQRPREVQNACFLSSDRKRTEARRGYLRHLSALRGCIPTASGICLTVLPVTKFVRHAVRAIVCTAIVAPCKVTVALVSPVAKVFVASCTESYFVFTIHILAFIVVTTATVSASARTAVGHSPGDHIIPRLPAIITYDAAADHAGIRLNLA